MPLKYTLIKNNEHTKGNINMPPQNSQAPQQPAPMVPQQSVPTPVQNTELLNKKIRNAGQSVLLLGCFFVFIGAIASLGISSVAADDRTRVIISLAITILFSIYWIIAGVQIKQNQNNPSKALSVMKVVLITAIILTVWRVVAIVMGGKLGIGDFTIVLAIYLLVAQSRIKQLANQ